MCRYVHDPSLHQASFLKCNSSQVVSIKQNVNFKIKPPAMFVFFAFRKNGLITSRSSSECKIPLSYIGWCKFCIHLKSLNVRHF
jgi:hypothetical protein